MSLDRETATAQQRLADFTADHRRLIAITLQSFTALKTGNIGIGGATGTLLEHTLKELESLTERLQLPPRNSPRSRQSVAQIPASADPRDEARLLQPRV